MEVFGSSTVNYAVQTCASEILLVSISKIDRSAVYPMYPPTPNTVLNANHSVKFRNLVSSSNSSCKSPSEILFWRLGISDLASSALSQHKLPAHSVSR